MATPSVAQGLQAVEYMDHFEILITQHQSIRQKLHSAQTASGATERTRLLERIRTEIELHTYLEEAHVYPVLEVFDSLRRQVFGFWKEHEWIRVALEETLSVHQDERMFQARLSELSSKFEEHAREEERHIFPEARRLLSSDQLERMERKLKATNSERAIAA